MQATAWVCWAKRLECGCRERWRQRVLRARSNSPSTTLLVSFADVAVGRCGHSAMSSFAACDHRVNRTSQMTVVKTAPLGEPHQRAPRLFRRRGEVGRRCAVIRRHCVSLCRGRAAASSSVRARGTMPLVLLVLLAVVCCYCSLLSTSRYFVCRSLLSFVALSTGKHHCQSGAAFATCPSTR